jgi:hypothetical protein
MLRAGVAGGKDGRRDDRLAGARRWADRVYAAAGSGKFFKYTIWLIAFNAKRR